jgi:hypothetical protein
MRMTITTTTRMESIAIILPTNTTTPMSMVSTVATLHMPMTMGTTITTMTM